MKFYLSSYKFGAETAILKTMLPFESKIGHINNSRDRTEEEPGIKSKHQAEEIKQLNQLGFIAEPLDLKHYFGKEDELRNKLNQLDGLWVSGGNTFVLRQAMKLSGFDAIFNELKFRQNFLYAGYSAGICVLCDSLKYIAHVDNPTEFPYQIKEVIWNGLSIFNYGILPHYDSDHIESEAIGKEIQNCIKNKSLFIALKDGEVLIINKEFH